MATEQSNDARREALYRELELQLDLAIRGIHVDAEEIDKLDDKSAGALRTASAASPPAFKQERPSDLPK